MCTVAILARSQAKVTNFRIRYAMSVRLSLSNHCRSEEPREVQHFEDILHLSGLPTFVGVFHYTVIPRITKIIRSGITFVSRNVISRRFL